MRRHFRTFWMPWHHVRWVVGSFSRQKQRNGDFFSVCRSGKFSTWRKTLQNTFSNEYRHFGENCPKKSNKVNPFFSLNYALIFLHFWQWSAHTFPFWITLLFLKNSYYWKSPKNEKVRNLVPQFFFQCQTASESGCSTPPKKAKSLSRNWTSKTSLLFWECFRENAYIFIVQVLKVEPFASITKGQKYSVWELSRVEESGRALSWLPESAKHKVHHQGQVDSFFIEMASQATMVTDERDEHSMLLCAFAWYDAFEWS